MGLIFRILFVFMCMAFVSNNAHAAWQGPVNVMTGQWGSGTGQFGLEEGDSGDRFPLLKAITIDGKIVISDTVNKKIIVINIDGTFIKDVKWLIKSQANDGTTSYNIPEYSFGNVVGYNQDGNIYSGSGSKYYLLSSTGQLIKTYTTRPLELGVVTEKALGNGKYKVTVKYPDREWVIIGDGIAPPYMRDVNGNLYSTGGTQAIRWNFCGKELARLTIPEGKEGYDFEEYGEAVVAPNGDVYTWKRTPDKYSIVKWTWVDDPNTPTGPDAPANLKPASSTTGLYLTWTASPQDPGCVSGYEISRSATSGGTYNVIATVDKSVLNYNDTTAEVGTTYYYKLRAKSGNDFSPYTAAASGKK